MTNLPKVALIGAGAMGGAMLRGWLENGAVDTAASAVFDPSAGEPMKALCTEHGLLLNPEISGRFDAVVIAIKPQMAEAVLPHYSAIAKDAAVISVMAGKSVARISEFLGGAEKTARVMPNLPAAIGKGVSGVYAVDQVSASERAMIETLMQATGDVVWVETEKEIDFVTAISGSGPAYFFLLTEALAEAGIALGMVPEKAHALARATCSGAGSLVAKDERSAADMRRAVTSPGGTTEAALNVLDGDEQAVRKLMNKALEAAAKRAGELTD
ncbi:pyrroline-5-carboxylate reductase [Hyphococcus formosus]|uniref:pyrroline-5-carboxylate reductase n=1 Tax=Hyphococcus formosus TaxID=3143534 RepID=UPI00398BB6BB